MYNNQDMHLIQISKTKTVFWKMKVCVFLSQLIIISFFNKLILTKVLGDYMIFNLGLLHMECCSLNPWTRIESTWVKVPSFREEHILNP